MTEEIILYFDGGSRKGIMAVGWIILDASEPSRILASGNKTCGRGTSNIAEYRALISGLYGAQSIRNVRHINIFGDSQLVVKQVNGIFRINSPLLQSHCDKARELLSRFNSYTLEWIPRRHNKMADGLVNQVFERRSNKCKSKRKK